MVYNNFITNDKINICFHKSCIDGLFSAIIILECMSDKTNYYDKYNLIPLSPTEITRRTKKIQELENQKKIILDLPHFGTNVLYYFDHHISNRQTTLTSKISGLLDISAASTCSVLKTYFNIPQYSDLLPMIEIADIIDQAKFNTPPPEPGTITLTTMDDLIWACNDLVKDIRDEKELIELVESFNKEDLQNWIQANKIHIMNYRKRRQETLDIKKELTLAPIIIIRNEKRNLQAEGLHFSLATEDPGYKMLILIDRSNKNTKNQQKRYKVSFRLNPKLDQSEMDFLRVDKIARELGGGGHKGAASATLHNIVTQYTKIRTWVDSLGLQYSEYNL